MSSALDDMDRLRTQLGDVEKSKLDRHLESLAAIAHAMGEPVGGFGDTWSGPLPGVLG